MAIKRPIVVEGNTPGKPSNKWQVDGRSRCSLFEDNKEDIKDDKNVSCHKPKNWTHKETSALVQYICLYRKDGWSNKWPMTKDKELGHSCAKSINNVRGCQRTGLLTSLLYSIFPQHTNKHT